MTEQGKGSCLINSKSEFNRCTLPRITAENREGIIEDLQMEEAAEKKVKAEIRWLKKRKRRRRERPLPLKSL